MKISFSRSRMAAAAVTAFGGVAAGFAPGVATSAPVDRTGTYVAGDFHNHTTCSDGAISMQKLVKKVTDKTETPWGLDWFVQAGHGGSGNRNCTLAEDASLATPAYPLVYSTTGVQQGPTTTWLNTNPPVQPKGLVSGSGNNQVMWRWQSIQEYQYPLLEYLSANYDQPLFMGIESVVAGHEHSSATVINGQVPAAIFTAKLPTTPGYAPQGNATALAKWEYCFDRGDTDTSRGNTTVGSTTGNNWDCSVTGSANAADPNWNTTAQKLIPVSGAGVGTRGHQKTVEAMKWMAEYAPRGSYYVPAHLERAGPFNPDGNNGYNVEDLRDFNNAAPAVAFGFETQPGHHASDARGEYTIRRNNIGGTNVDSVGGTTYGGTGVYGAQIGGVWDALLGEGRNYFFFASSDWHNRGQFGPDDRRSTQDFYPGEFQRTYVNVVDTTPGKKDTPLTPQEIVDGLRSGNAWATEGQLIDRLSFVACAFRPRGFSEADVEKLAIDSANGNTSVVLGSTCATMGQKLVVSPGSDVIVSVVVRDPTGKNFSPYSFANPSLAQIGAKVPLDRPVLDHVDVIRGLVTGYKAVGAADYKGQWPNDWIQPYLTGGTPSLSTVPAAAKNTTAAVIKTYGNGTWKSQSVFEGELKVMTFRVSGVTQTQYLRLRGSNLPASVPFETDASGNPLPDIFTNAASVNPTKSGGTDGLPANSFLRIPCTTVGTNEYDGCPSHLGTVAGQKYSSYDVAAWSDLWFYSNPIFVEVSGATQVAGAK